MSVPIYVPPPALCVDNGAMIAAAAFYRLLHDGPPAGDDDPYLVEVNPGLGLPAVQ